MNLRRHLALAVLLVFAASAAHAKPPANRKPLDPKKFGSAARVNYGRELRPPREATGRRTDKPTLEEDTAAKIQKFLRQHPQLSKGVTGLYVADAKTGEPLFAVNANDPLNPASNVKMISTATALELLGPTFRYPTRVMGAEPVGGVVKGDVYLLGSHDPMLVLAHFDQLAAMLTKRGVTRIEGNVITGPDDTRDGIFRAVVAIEIYPGEPGGPPKVIVPKGFDFVTIKNTATTGRQHFKPRLTYKVETTTANGAPRIELSIGGTIGKAGKVDYPLDATTARTATAAHALIAAMRARSIALTGAWKTAELGDFVGAAVARGALPMELGRHESVPITEIVNIINKWSVNWLADRLVITAAALAKGQPATMELALTAMYRWLDRHPHISKKALLLDTGSGLSYQTQISATELVSIIRSAGGYTKGFDPELAKIWMRSLAVAGVDGTLRGRFRATSTHGGRIIAKTGTLSTVIALSGIVDLDPQRPLAFALVTNTDTPLSKPIIRKAHEQVISEICKYVRTTSRVPIKAPPPPPPPSQQPTNPDDDEPDEAGR